MVFLRPGCNELFNGLAFRRRQTRFGEISFVIEVGSGKLRRIVCIDVGHVGPWASNSMLMDGPEVLKHTRYLCLPPTRIVEFRELIVELAADQLTVSANGLLWE
jgi:hypothetical protein